MATKLMNQFQVSGYVAKVSTKDFKNSVLAEILLSVRHAIKKNDETVYESALLPCERWIRTDQKEEYVALKGKLVTCTGFFGIDAYETGGEKHSKITFVLKDIEQVPAKDNNTEDGE